MIIRKPYAFLIKNFRLIHFLILLVSSYILYRSLNALNFFNEYVATRQFIESDTLINDTVPFSIVFFSVFLIISCISIFILFRKKDKPTLFYVFGILYYIAFIVICIFSRGIINTIMFEGIDPRISRIVRDMWFIAVVLEIPVVVFSLIRTLGFDVKKFNFGEDLHELQIDSEDNEEVEINTAFDAEKVRMKAAMQKEELKAFFYENKFMIIVVIILLFFVIPSTFIAKNIIDNKRYKVGEVIKLDGFNLKITGAYLTKKNYKGDILFKGNNSYLIVSFNISNSKENEKGINLNNLRLEVNEKIYMPKTNYYDNFVDIGVGYNGEKISNDSKDYIVVYTISDEDISNEMIIRYADKITVKNLEASAVYYRTLINPEDIDTERTLVNRTVGQDLIIDFKQFEGTKFNISHYNLKNDFTYELNGKNKYIINSTGLVLLLKYSFVSENMTFSNFITKNAIIRYKYNNNTYTQKINDITPLSIKNQKNDEIYLAVSENLKDASEISIVVNVRNTEYVYKIK